MKNILIVCLLLTGLSLASPSSIGTNGLVNMPTAMSIKYKEFDLAANWRVVQNTSDGSRYQLNYISNLGIFDGVEAGFIGNNQKEGVFPHIKFYMMSDKTAYPLALAAGLTNLSSHSRSDLYLVMSKKFPNNFFGHFGFTSNIIASSIKANIMFGIEASLSPYMSIIGDLIGSESTWNLSTGFRLKLSEDFLLNAYLEDIASSTVDKATFTLGLSWHGLFQ